MTNKQPISNNEVTKTDFDLPFKLERGFTRIPNGLFRVYTSHPKFNPTCFLLYSLLLQNYNYKLGYAFPTQAQLAITLGVDVRTIQRTTNVLKELRLITTIFSPEFANNRYTFPRPAETVHELEKWFPEITPHLEKLSEKNRATHAVAEKDWKRLREWRAANGILEEDFEV